MKKKHLKKYKYIYIAIIIITLGYFIYLYSNVFFKSSSSVSQIDLKNMTSYTDNKYNFSFMYPKTLQLNSFPGSDNASEVILLRTSTTTEQGIQLIVSSFDEPETDSITIDRIHHDVPSMDTENVNDITIDGVGKGVSFFDGIASSSKEQAWFVAKGLLYQITATRDSIDALNAMIQTFKFF